MFTLIQLLYAMEALEPVISAETISFHHGKHLQAYVDNLNKLLPGSEFEGMALEEIVRKAPAGPVFNWLSADSDGSLVITQEQGASNPVVKGLKPLLTFDVWEHAYYLDYQNRRAAHLSALWQIIDWSVIAARYE